MKFKAAIIQTNTPNDIAAARLQTSQLVTDAAKNGAQFIATPEGTNLLERNKTRFKEICPFENDKGEIEFYGDLARKNKVQLLIGSILLQTKEGKAYNRSCLFNAQGELIAQYDKIHLFDVDLGNGQELRESDNFRPGYKAIVAPTEYGEIGLSVCYDVRFAHLYRGLAQRGAQILTIPAAFTVPTGKAHWEVLLRARAIENGAYVIAPAQGGKHKDGRETYGHSMIINPWGEIIAHMNNDATGFAIAEIDLDQVHDARRKIPAWNLNRGFDFND